jgi:hypothetical protein
MKITMSKRQWEELINREETLNKKDQSKETTWNKKAQSENAKDVICDSGIKGWQDKLQNVYQSLEELISYDNIYGICKRLGYEDPKKCWEENPTIQGSINPSDLKRV